MGEPNTLYHPLPPLTLFRKLERMRTLAILDLTLDICAPLYEALNRRFEGYVKGVKGAKKFSKLLTREFFRFWVFYQCELPPDTACPSDVTGFG